jgi:hypothetical protein
MSHNLRRAASSLRNPFGFRKRSIVVIPTGEGEEESAVCGIGRKKVPRPRSQLVQFRNCPATRSW